MNTTISSTRRYCRTPTRRSSAPRSRAIAVMPAAPPAIIANAPVTGLIPGCSRMSDPAVTLSASVPRVTPSTGSQFVATVRRVCRSTRAPMATPTTACAAVLPASGTRSRSPSARARTSPATSPPNRAGDGSPRRANRRLTATAPARTAAASISPRRCTPVTLPYGRWRPLGAGSVRRSGSGDPAQLGHVGGEGRPAGRGEGQAGALPRGDGRLAHGDVAGVLELLDVLGQHRVAHPDGVADGGELHRVDRGEQAADLQPRRCVD